MFEKDKGLPGKNAAFGIFNDRAALEHCVDTLKARGFRNSDISVLMASREETRTFAHENSTKSPEAATVGATGGLAIGGALGWLAGIGTLAIPGIGPFVAAGPILATIAGAGIGGTVGGIAGGLIGLGIPEYEAKRYESLVHGGGLLLSVHVDNSEWTDKAKDILKECGAKDISVKSEVREDSSRKDEVRDASFTPKSSPDRVDPQTDIRRM